MRKYDHHILNAISAVVMIISLVAIGVWLGVEIAEIFLSFIE